jgi:hypothetical protein
MKKYIFNPINLCGLSAILIVFASVSCKKYNSAGFTPGTGAPSITSVHTLSKTDTTLRYDTVTAYNSSGDTTLSLKQAPSQVSPFDSATTAGNLGNYYIINGSNLGGATSITFNGATAYFNRALISDNSIIVQVPSTTPYSGPQATDSLVVTTLHGKAYYKFNIIPPPPTPSTWSDYNLWAGSQISLTGVGFAGVTAVALNGTTAHADILSQSDTTLVLRFPSTTVNRTNLVFTYTSLGNTLTETSTQELVDLDNAYAVFYKGNFQNDWTLSSFSHNASVGDANDISINGTTHSVPGTASFVLDFPNGGYKMEGWAGSNTSPVYLSAYTYYTFWIKGGVQQEIVTISADQLPTPWLQPTGAGIFTITVPPGVWTYFKIPIGSGSGQLNFQSPAVAQSAINTSKANRLSFFIPGPSGTDEVLYVDEVGFVK